MEKGKKKFKKEGMQIVFNRINPQNPKNFRAFLGGLGVKSMVAPAQMGSCGLPYVWGRPPSQGAKGYGKPAAEGCGVLKRIGAGASCLNGK